MSDALQVYKSLHLNPRSVSLTEFWHTWQRHCEEEWYVGNCNRTDAEHVLHLVNKVKPGLLITKRKNSSVPHTVFLHGPRQDGAFLVRDCSVDSDSEPLVLVVYNEKKVYNVKIRFAKDTGKYALGMQQHSNNVRLVDSRQVRWSVTTTHYHSHPVLLPRRLTGWLISSSTTPSSPSCWSVGDQLLGADTQRTVCWTVRWPEETSSNCCSDTDYYKWKLNWL